MKTSGYLYIHLISKDLHIYSTVSTCFQAFKLISNGCRFSFPLQMIKAFLYATRSRCCWLFKLGACYQLLLTIPFPVPCWYPNVFSCHLIYFLITENALKVCTSVALDTANFNNVVSLLGG